MYERKIVMILYFTGTGNSRFAAEYIADHIGDDCISLNDILKYKRPLRFNSVRPFIIVAPIYAWGFPDIVKQLIIRAEFTGSDQMYFIGTMGSQTGDAENELEKIAYQKEMAYLGFCGVPMPDNFIWGGDLPDGYSAERKIRASLPLLHELSDRIMTGKMIEKCDQTPLAFLASAVASPMFNKFFKSRFRVSEKCTGCGMCEKVCPVNNVKLLPGGIPHFDRYCLNCYSCINRCPSKAINIGKRTENFNRYICPEYSDWKKRGLI